MGYNTYSQVLRSVRADTRGYATKSTRELFSSNMHPSMDPRKALLRESRDSETHPLSVPIIIALDLTGSMDLVPKELISNSLPKIISSIMEAGYADPQVLFLGVGDHKCDTSPLQVGQFESGDEELDTWLTRTWLESGGGGNGGESYGLAWYFAGHHTVTDSWEKRKVKGFIFTIGDEPIHEYYPSSALKDLMGVGVEKSFSAQELYDIASKQYHIFHISLDHNSRGARPFNWKEIVGEGLLFSDVESLSKLIPSKIVEILDRVDVKKTVTKVVDPTNKEQVINIEEIL